MKFPSSPAPELFRPPVQLSTPIQFRLATKADLDGLHATCFPTEPAQAFAARFDSALRLQAAGRLLHVLALHGEPPLPVASGQLISYTDTVAEIADLVVAGSMRGQGVGTALLRVLGALAAAAGAERLELAARVDNERALALYRRLGFRASRLLRFPSGERAVLLARAPWSGAAEEEFDGSNPV
ncbi:MAG: GNAT family N-acetyltransferase [Anaerolineae bacterium]|nr:GNAT family N-acetyltransferase [Anaerolineae bacterium]